MFYLLSRAVSTVAGSIYPAYASYKAIKQNDAQQLEVWLMFWVVMGSVFAVEHSVEWLVSWFPFYFECKTLLILWLTLPQIQGSTYIYVEHLHPFLSAHESEIDQALADAQNKAKKAGLEWLNTIAARIRELVVGSLNAGSSSTAEAADAGSRQSSTASGPSMTSPPPSYEQSTGRNGASNGLYTLAGNYLRTYAPAALAAGTALLHPMSGRTPSVSRRGDNPSVTSTRSEQMRSLGVASASGYSTGTNATLTRADARRRRAELEAELAHLSSAVSSDGLSVSSSSSFSSPPPSSSASNRSASSSAVPQQQQTQQVYLQQHQQQSQRFSGGHPRSASTGNLPLSSNNAGVSNVPSIVERSFVAAGFEEIGRDEVLDQAFPPEVPVKRQSTGVGSGGSWWRWSSNAQQGSDTNVLSSAAAASKKRA